MLIRRRDACPFRGFESLPLRQCRLAGMVRMIRNVRELEIKSVNPVSVLSIYTAVSIIISIIVLLVFDHLHYMSLLSFERFSPIPLEGVLRNLANPFTIALILGLIAGLGCGIVFCFIALLYNLFASVMGGIKINVSE